ncbi:LysR substrate-binding domain-containing protein [Streptomyces sp. NPDC056069]|uniref:LysR substrate-binding domain-containing protein n=1 Tax=Streptomyces sp. NPDC056069 TaxID=3345702 RepID=UPI0035E2A80F
MDIRQLKYFVIVAEELHFGRAAQRLHIGQSTVSQQIARLEKDLGVRLFERSSRSVRLSVEGLRVLPLARDVLGAVDALGSQVREMRDTRNPVLSLGSGSGLGRRLDVLLDVLQDFTPGLTVRFENFSRSERVERVRSGKLDGAFLRGAEEMSGLERIPLWTEELVVALPSGHAVAGSPTIGLSDLRDLPLRIVPRAQNPSLYDMVVRACQENGFQPVLGRPFATQYDTLAEMAMGDDAWTVLYETNANTSLTRRVSFHRLRAQALTVEVCLLVRRDMSPELLVLLRGALHSAGEAAGRLPTLPAC